MKKGEDVKDSYAQTITGMYEKLDSLHTKISEMRRLGKDTLYADILLRGVRSKLHYCEVSRKPEDMEKVKGIIEQAEQELEEENVRIEKTFTDELDELVQKNKDLVKKFTSDELLGKKPSADERTKKDEAKTVQKRGE